MHPRKQIVLFQFIPVFLQNCQFRDVMDSVVTFGLWCSFGLPRPGFVCFGFSHNVSFMVSRTTLSFTVCLPPRLPKSKTLCFPSFLFSHNVSFSVAERQCRSGPRWSTVRCTNPQAHPHPAGQVSGTFPDSDPPPSPAAGFQCEYSPLTGCRFSV